MALIPQNCCKNWATWTLIQLCQAGTVFDTGLLKYCTTDHADEERLEVDPVGQKADNGDASNILAFLKALLQSLHFGVDVKVWSAQEAK